MQSMKKIHAWAQMQEPLSKICIKYYLLILFCLIEYWFDITIAIIQNFSSGNYRCWKGIQFLINLERSCLNVYYKWASAWHFQQCGMFDQQRLRPACAYTQSDQSLCLSLEFSMSVALLAGHLFEVVSLKGVCTCLSESALVKMPHCWKSNVTAQLSVLRSVALKRREFLLVHHYSSSIWFIF